MQRKATSRENYISWVNKWDIVSRSRELCGIILKFVAYIVELYVGIAMLEYIHVAHTEMKVNWLNTEADMTQSQGHQDMTSNPACLISIGILVGHRPHEILM